MEPREETCIAVCSSRDAWFLLDAPGGIHREIEAYPDLRPRGRRHSPLQGFVLTSGDVDRCLGLFSFREGQPVVLHATEHVYRAIADRNVLFRTLRRTPDQERWIPLELGRERDLICADGRPSGLAVMAFPVQGKLPPHLEGVVPLEPEANVGLRVRDLSTKGVLVYAPGVGALSQELLGVAAEADSVLFDGTFWTSDELRSLGVSERHAEEMGHLPVGGPQGSLAKLGALRARRRIFVHVNNTNPMLRADGPERARVRAAGWEVAQDGLEVDL